MSGRVVIVTGAASGIGRKLVAKLDAAGDRIIAADVNEAALRKTAEDDRWSEATRAALYPLDVRSASAWRACVEGVVAIHGRLDVLVNVAGILVPVYAKDATDQDVDRTLDINAKGLMHGTNAAVRQMVAQKSGQIVNVASLAGIIPVPGLALYSASKHAARAYSIAVAQEVRQHNVFVTAVCPTLVATPMMDIQVDHEEAAFVFSSRRALTVDEVTSAIVDRAMVKKPLELLLTVPWTIQGVIAKLGNMVPEIAFMLGDNVAKSGRDQQKKLSPKG